MKIAFVFLLVFVGCNFTKSRTNLPQDNQNAIGCCKTFDNFRMSNENASAIKMMSADVNEEKLYGVFDKVDSTLGNLVSFEVGTVASNVETKNGVEAGAYSVDFNCVYENGKATEHFDLSSDNARNMKITGFHVNWDL